MVARGIRLAMKVGDKTKWIINNEDGWAGSGRAEVIGYDPNRAYFGAKGTGQATPGPAVKIRLVDAPVSGTPAAEVWVSPDELMPDLEAAMEGASAR
jgi:hypothetical protein